MISLGITAPFGPIGQIPNTFLIDENYLKVVRNHELFLGTVGFITALVANFWLSVKDIYAIIAAIIGGSLYFIGTQASDPDFLNYVVTSLIDFNVNYLASGAVVYILFFLTKKITWHYS